MQRIYKAFHTYVPTSTMEFWSRVARWFIFKPKIPIWVNFRGPQIGKSWNILWPFGIFTYGYLVYFMTIWYILCSFGTFVPDLVSCTKKNLATLFWSSCGLVYPLGCCIILQLDLNA
jgi:hypothetical protein